MSRGGSRWRSRQAPCPSASASISRLVAEPVLVTGHLDAGQKRVKMSVTTGALRSRTLWVGRAACTSRRRAFCGLIGFNSGGACAACTSPAAGSVVVRFMGSSSGACAACTPRRRVFRPCLWVLQVQRAPHARPRRRVFVRFFGFFSNPVAAWHVPEHMASVSSGSLEKF